MMCKDCKYWNQTRTMHFKNVQCECIHPKIRQDCEDGMMVRAEVDANIDIDVATFTGPQFGCINFKRLVDSSS